MPESLQANLEAVREAIRASTERASRDANAVALVAVTKTVPVERIREAIRLGLHTFGENRVQEALPKMDEIGPAKVDWHLIGHLQTNKIKFVEGRFQMVQSVDRAGRRRGWSFTPARFDDHSPDGGGSRAGAADFSTVALASRQDESGAGDA